MDIFLPVEGERTEIFHHGIEPVVLFCLLVDGLVASDACQRHELAPECTYHIVVEVPGLHTEGLPGIHCIPRIRSLERSEVQQTFVHNGQCICHFTALLFAHPDAEFFQRAYCVRH